MNVTFQDPLLAVSSHIEKKIFRALIPFLTDDLVSLGTTLRPSHIHKSALSLSTQSRAQKLV